MRKFEIKYDKQPRKFLRKLNKQIIRRVMQKIDELLVSNPFPHDAKPIIGEHGLFRVRIGDYRALYRVNYQTGSIIIVKIDKRSKIY